MVTSILDLLEYLQLLYYNLPTGMKPLFFSVYNAVNEQIGWTRFGSDICYYRNTYMNQTAGGKIRPYQTTSFNITFPHARDVCYLAYHYPYPYSRMLVRFSLFY